MHVNVNTCAGWSPSPWTLSWEHNSNNRWGCGRVMVDASNYLRWGYKPTDGGPPCSIYHDSMLIKNTLKFARTINYHNYGSFLVYIIYIYIVGAGIVLSKKYGSTASANMNRTPLDGHPLISEAATAGNESWVLDVNPSPLFSALLHLGVIWPMLILAIR